VTGDPATQEWRQTLGESTSAQLRRTQQALAASQADLTRVEAERDALTLLLAEARRELADTKPCSWRGLAEQLLRERADAARSGWIVARDGGRPCVFCDQEIRRGQAYELVPGGGLDDLRHVHCDNEPAWAVADRLGVTCEACKEPIVRGQAFKPLPAAKGSLVHVICPAEEKP